MSDKTREAMAEQNRLSREWAEARARRILRVAAENPSMGYAEFAERFGSTVRAMEDWLNRRGIYRDEFDGLISRKEARRAKAP